MDRIRSLLLQVHGSLLLLIGVGSGVNSTVGWLTGDGMMGFLTAHRMGHVGLVQAYLLMAVVGVVLWMGSRRVDTRPWNRIGALAHLAVLPAYAFHWNYFPEVTPDGGKIRLAIIFHLTFIILESIAGFTPLRATEPEAVDR